MKKFLKSSLVIFLIFSMILGICPLNGLVDFSIEANATQSKSYNFSTDYAYSEDPATYMVNIALAQKDKTQSQLGYTEAWCANFVSDCAKLAGQTAAIPANGYVPSLWDAIINAGGREVYSRQKGDIIFYDCPSCDTTGDGVSLEHVGIVIDETYSVEGNLSRMVKMTSTFTDSAGHSTSGVVKRRYLRPNYTGGVQRDTRIDVWASTKGEGYQYYDCPEITYGTTQNRYYIWFKVFDANTGDLYNSYSNTSYTSTVSIRYSDGTEFYSYAYSNSDSSWISVVPQKSDTYTINITLTGDIQGNYSQSFVVGYDADLIANKSSVTLDLQGTNSSTITFTPSGSYPGYKGMKISRDEDYIQIDSSGWNNGVYSLSFSGLKAGKTTITANLYEAYTGNESVVATVTINVTINGPSYTLSYNSNGGTGAPSAQTGGSEYAIALDMPTRTGYTFAGWAKSSSASNASYYPREEITLSSNTTLYAVWKPATTISTGTTTVEPLFINQTVCYKFVPSVSGTYKFTGKPDSNSLDILNLTNLLYLYDSSGSRLKFDLSSDTTTPASFSCDLIAGNTYYFTTRRYNSILASGNYDVSIELVSASSYNLSYNANGGSGAPSGQTGATSYTISSTVPTRFGYTFLGWSKSSSATSATYEPGDSINLSSGTTLYAVWKSAPSMNAHTSYPAVVNFENQEIYYSFTPSSSGDYVFESVGSLDTRVYVYTSSGSEIGYDDDSSDEGTNFKLTLNLTSGTKYYVKVRAYSSNTGSSVFSVIKDTPATYTLSYSANGGSGTPSNHTGATSYTISSTVPTRFGYNFIGWSKSSSATSATYKSGDTITLTSNTTLYAVWSQPQISVNSSATANIASGEQVYYFKLSPSSGASYVIYSTGDSDTKAFLYDSDGNEVENDDDDGENRNFRICRNLTGGSDYILAVKYYSSSTTGNISVKFGYAYGVYYYANGGSGDPDDQVKDYGKDLTLSTTIPTRSGYTFLGWSTSSSSTTVTYSPGDVYSSNSPAYLYAVWEEAKYDLIYDGNGYSSYNSSIFGIVTTTIKTTLPNRKGYTFLGWSKDRNATSATYKPGDSITLTADTTLYAVWKQTTLSSASSVTTPITYANQIYYYKFTPTTSGTYVFYSAGSDDTKVYLYNSSGSELASDDDSGDDRNFRLSYNLASGNTYYFAVKYYSESKTGSISAKFGPVYTVSYNANGGAEAPSSQTKDYGENITLSDIAPTRSGYTFLGWSTSSSATTATYTTGDIYSSNSNTTLYAVWEANSSTYTLNYNANGGSGAPSSQTGATSYTISSTVPTRFGYTFLGWSKSSSATYATYKPDDNISLSSNATLYAVWRSVGSISLDYSLSVPITTAGQEQLVKFVPDFSKSYTIESSGSDDTYVYLYDEEGNMISYNDDGGDNQNFSLSYDLVAGETYYYGIKFYDSTKTGTISVSLNVENSSIAKGDVNDDGYVDATDASLIARYDAGYVTLTSAQLAVADVNEDGYVDATDASLIARYDAGYISEI